jgi:hypothetical protein
MTVENYLKFSNKFLYFYIVKGKTPESEHQPQKRKTSCREAQYEAALRKHKIFNC